MATVNYTQHRYNGSSWDDLYPKTQASQVMNLIDTVYPIGSIYMSVSSTNPATLFGTGTWQAIGQGRVLMGVGTGSDGTNSMTITSMATGGEYQHTLTVSEMPSHYHTTYGANCSPSTASDAWTVMRGVGRSNPAGTSDLTANAGGGTSHNNVQPYYGVYMWRRTG